MNITIDTDSIIEFVTDPLRLTLIIAGAVVLLAILVLGRRSKQRDMYYKGSSSKEYEFSSMPDDMLVDEEVIVLPRRKTESEVLAEAAAKQQAEIDAEANSDNKDERDLPKVESFEANPYGIETLKPEQNSSEKETPKEPVATQQKQTPKQTTVPKQHFVVLHVIASEGKAFTGRSIFNATQTLGMAVGKYNVFHYPADSAYVGDSAFCMTNMTVESTFDVANLEKIETNGVSLILTLPTIYSDGLTVFSNMLAVAQALSKKLGGDIIDQNRMPLTADLVTSMRTEIENFESNFKQSQLKQSNPVLES